MLTNYILKTKRGKLDSRKPINPSTNSSVRGNKKGNILTMNRRLHLMPLLFFMLINLGNAKATSPLEDWSGQGMTQTSSNSTNAKNDINQMPPNATVGGNVLENDTDEEGDGQTVQSASYLDSGSTSQTLTLGQVTDIYDEAGTLAGSFMLNQDGTYGFVSALNYTGKVKLEYVVTDDNTSSATDTATLSIKVIPYPPTDGSNNSPVAQDDANIVEQGMTVYSYIMMNDSDPDGDAVYMVAATAQNEFGQTITLSSSAQGIYDENGEFAGNASIAADGNIIFKAALAYIGQITINYTIEDIDNDTDAAALVIRVEPSNGSDNDSYANDDASVGLQKTTIGGNILANDFDPEGDTQSITAVSNKDGIAITLGEETSLEFIGSIILASNGKYSFTPEPYFTGTERIIYTICDDNSTATECETATLYLTVLPTNSTAAENDINQTSINTAIGGSVLTNDRDREGDSLTVQSATYLDASGDSTALVLGVETLIYTASGASAGTMELFANGTYNFSPTIGFTGMAPLSYVMTDDNLNPAIDDATLAIEVLENPLTDGTNNGMVAHDDTNTGSSGSVIITYILANDVDLDRDSLIVAQVKGLNATGASFLLNTTNQPVYDEKGLLGGVASIQEGGQLVLKTAQTYVGDIPFTYAIIDGNGLFDLAAVTITVEAVNSDFDTYANDDSNIGWQDETLTGSVQTNDYDPEGIDQDVILIDTDGDGIPETLPEVLADIEIYQNGVFIGIFTMDAKVGEYVWDPIPSFTGTVIMPYTITDGDINDIATLYLTNLPINSTDAVDDFNNTLFETPVVGNVSTNDFDLEGDNQEFALEGANGGMSTSEGTVSLNNNGSYIFTPATGFSGGTQFSYNACDDGYPIMCETAIVYIQVLPEINPEGQPIIANPDVNSIAMGQTAIGNVLSNDLDPEGRDLQVTTTIASGTIVSGINSRGEFVTDAGTLELNNNGIYIFTPIGDFIGTVTQNYTACTVTAPAECDNSVLIIDVVPLINAGNTTVANDDAIISDIGIPVDGNLLENDYDPEGDGQTVTAFYYDSNGDGVADTEGAIGENVTISGYDEAGIFVSDFGTLNVASNGIFTFTPSAGFPGNSVIPYTACDNNTTVACDNATLVITVLNVYKDFTDAPAIYPVAWHRAITDKNNDNQLDGATDVWLGTGTNFEISSLASSDASMDGFDDALSFGSGEGEFPEVMLPSADYDIDILLNSIKQDFVYYALWIDWDNDGTYDDFYNGSAVTNGATTVGVTITAPTFIGATVNMRLRADDDELFEDDFFGVRTNGEVEDYQNVVSLPVDLIYFEGNENGCTNEIRWATASEKNNSFFMIEHSTDGEHFEHLQKIEGNGNSSEEIEYSYVHKDITHVYNYYRLMQVDFDNTFEYSEVVFIKSDCQGLTTEGINIYPNPSIGWLKAEIMNDSAEDKEIEIMVTDVAGRVVIQKTIMIQAGINREDINLYDYPSGVYMISIINDGKEIDTYPISLIMD